MLSRARSLIDQRYRTGTPVFQSHERTREFLTPKLAHLEHEVFAMLALDNRRRLRDALEPIGYPAMSRSIQCSNR